MINMEKHINFWRQGAREDWDVALELVNKGRTRHGLFFAHLALEKALKALVCQNTRDLAPRIHNLVRLAEFAGITLQPEQLDILAGMNAFNVEGRYPDSLAPQPTKTEAHNYLAQSGEVFQWLLDQL